MNKLIVVRDGTTTWQEQDRIQGVIPLPLCEAGEKALGKVIGLLKLEKLNLLYSSGNESSGATAEYLCQFCDLKYNEMDEFREMNFGLWQGLRIKDIQQRFSSVYKQWRKDPFSICPPQGETLQQVQDRIRPALQKVLDANSGKTTIIVAAQMAAAVMDCILTNIPLNRLWDNAEENATLLQYIGDSYGEEGDASYKRTTLLAPAPDSLRQKVTV